MIDGTFLKLLLKKDWIKLSGFLIGIAGMTVGVAVYFPTLYNTQAARNAIVLVLKSPAMSALFGPFKLEPPYTTAGIFGYEMLIWVILLAVIANLTIAIPNSRGDEERGIVELLMARAMSRQAWLNTVGAELLAFNGVLVLINGGGLMLVNMAGSTIAADWLFALLVGVTGLMFGALSLLLAQIFSTGRNTIIFAYVVVAISYLIMAIASTANATAWVWSAIIAWGTESGVYATNQWWPLVLLTLGTLLFYGTAYMLLRQRDLDAGLLPDRPGRAKADWHLQGPATLLLQTQGLTGIVWLVMIFVFGYAYGSAFQMMGNLAHSNQVVSALISTNGGRTIVMNFMVLLSVLFGILGAVPGIMILNHLVTDEKKGYLESLHAKPVGRTRLFLIYALFGWLLSVLVLGAGVLGMAVGSRISMTTPLEAAVFWRTFTAMIAPISVMMFAQAMIVGAIPKFKNLIWLFAYLAFFYGYFGNMLKLPHWLGKLTPYGWLPKVPVAHMDWTTGTIMLFIADILLLAGAWTYCQRDLETD